MQKLSVAQARKPESAGQAARLQGWIRTRRDSKGGFSFLELNDGSSLANMQIVADANLPNYESEIKRLVAGCSVTVEGELKTSPGKAQATELHAASVAVHGWADPETYPLQKKRHSFEYLRTIGHLRPRTNTFRRDRSRAKLPQPLDPRFFSGSTSFSIFIRRSSRRAIAKAPGRCFSVTTLDPAQPPRVASPSGNPIGGQIDWSRDFFGKPAYLTVSGQLEGEIFATALGKVYTFGPTFRAENSNTSRHLAEFWMVEPEMAFFELADNMELAEAFLKRIFGDVLERCHADLELFNEHVDKTVLATLECIVASEFARLPYTDAIETAAQGQDHV